MIIEGEQLGDYRVNINGDYDNASLVVEDTVVKFEEDKYKTGNLYKVINKPRYNTLHNTYKLNMRPIK